MNLWLTVLGLVVLIAGWFAPVRGWRRWAAMLVRMLGLLALALALRGWSIPHRHEVSRHIVYLVDQSDSIDAEQTRWLAGRLASLEALRPISVSRTVLAFGEQAAVIVPTGHARLADVDAIERALKDAPITRHGTNLEAALLAAFSAMPARERSRVIVLSDGRQTVGNVERLLTHVKPLGLETYPVVVASTQPTGLVWERLTVPPTAPRGGAVPIRLTMSNGTAGSQPIEATVRLDGVPIATKRFVVRPGWQVLSMSVPAYNTGTMRLEVGVQFPKEDAPQRREAFTEVQGAPRILVVLQRPTELPLLASALKNRQMDVAVSTVPELPTAAPALLDYDAVVLFHLPKSTISQPQTDALKEYVERFGGGVLMVGLDGDLRQEILQESPLDAILPVKFEPKGVQEAQRRVCMLMLIDRSASMYGPRIAATKRAAVELIKQLDPEDLVGVLAFDTMPYVLVEVMPAAQAAQIVVDKLVRLRATGGTNIYPAITAAQQRLEATGATVKHVILLSDGNNNTEVDVPMYRRLLAELKQQHISISSIGIGSVDINTDFLDWVAEATGGTMYILRSLDELPLLVARDTQQALGRLPFTEGMFRPVRSQAASWFADIVDWPALKGYLTTSAKPGAIVELEIRRRGSPPPPGQAPEPSVDEAHPLLAHWPRGAGQVTVFTSDADARWAPDWVRWPQFESVWAEVIRRTMRPQPSEELFVWLNEQVGSSELIVEGALNDPSAELLTPQGEQTIPLSLAQHGGTRWTASVDHVPDGWYRLVLRSGGQVPGQDASSGGAQVVTQWVRIGHPQDTEAERQHLPPNEALMRQIAQTTHGVLDVPDRAFVPPTEWVEQTQPLRGWLIPLMMVLLLLDVLIRGRTML